MRALVIGGDGFIGSHLLRALRAAHHQTGWTTRRNVELITHMPERSFMNLAHLPFDIDVDYDVAYLCAGISGFRECEGNPEAYRVNVDGTIAVAKAMLKAGVFVVFISSDAVEWGINYAYAHHKALVEVFLTGQAYGLDPAIVRAGKVTEATVDSFVHILIDIGVGRIEGVTRWKGGPTYA